MPETQTEPTMLTHIGEAARLPTEEELAAASLALGEATEPVNCLEMNLGRDDIRLTAEEAWHLTHFARRLELEAWAIQKEAESIRERTEAIYDEHVE